jgi:hypothetical protein
MRKLAFKFLWLAMSLIIGFAIGYAATSISVVAASPVGLNLARTSDPSTRVFVEMARLKQAEAVLGSCKYASIFVPQQSSLQAESALIEGLRIDTKASGFAPPLDVAEAIWELRSDNAFPKTEMDRTGPEIAKLVELLSRSGWPEDSQRLLRQALKKMDEACK